MARGSPHFWPMAALAAALGACTQTSRVDEGISTASLSQTRRAVAVMRVGAASPTCVNVAVLLGVREGAGYRRHQGITVMNVRSLVEPAVAEVELETYRTSMASFRLEPGEIVNVGYLHVDAWRHGLNMFGRRIATDIDVTDWPLAELDRYKAKRPELYAQMKTRLMTVTPGQGPPTREDCARLQALKAEGKVQTLPEECTRASPPKRTPAAVAKPGGNG
jgi:hypothetical protein